jgi:SOS-response transcriptional repressor LexA
MNKMTFGERLIAVRKHYGVNITMMSEKMGIVKSNISRYERNLVKPTTEYLHLLIKHYRVNLNWLFGENEEMILNTKQRGKFSRSYLKNLLEKDIMESSDRVIEAVSYTSFGIPIFGDIESFEKQYLPISGSISAGAPMEIRADEYSDFVPFPTQKNTADLDNYLVFRINGLSMAPDIAHEDIVYIRRNDNWFELNNKIVAVMIKGEMTLKKMFINEKHKQVDFKALNKDFQDISIAYDMMDSTFLIGELKAIRRIYM